MKNVGNKRVNPFYMHAPSLFMKAPRHSVLSGPQLQLGLGLEEQWLFLEEVKKYWAISTGASCWPFILIGLIFNFPYHQWAGPRFAELMQNRVPEG